MKTHVGRIVAMMVAVCWGISPPDAQAYEVVDEVGGMLSREVAIVLDGDQVVSLDAHLSDRTPHREGDPGTI